MAASLDEGSDAILRTTTLGNEVMKAQPWEKPGTRDTI
jgi:hypothetical protein